LEVYILLLDLLKKFADVFEQWANGAAWMGFNGSNVTDLGSWENLVELLA